MFRKLLIVAALVTLTACGKQVPDEVTREAQNKALTAAKVSLEGQRANAKANSEYNAQLYRAQNPRFTSDFNIVSRADTSQTLDCPPGDGWAELSIMRLDPQDNKKVDKTVLMCSTYSSSVGCYRKEDFMKDPQLSGLDGKCNSEVPNPLPVLKK